MAGKAEVFDKFKKLCQRLEWWPEMDPRDVIDFMGENGITYPELVKTLNAYALNPKYVMGQIEGIVSAKDIFKKEIGNRFYGERKICFITCTNKESELAEMNA